METSCYGSLKKVREFFRYRLTFWEHLSDRPPAHMKTIHSRKGRNALRKLGELLELEEVKVSYIPSDSDVGTLTLIGMKGGKGIYVSISSPPSFGSEWQRDILYRTVKDMEDYFGGCNQFLRTQDFVNDPEGSLAAMKRLLS